MAEPDRVEKRRVMLAELAASLMALAQRMQSQQDRAAEVCALGVRAEEIAGRARKLAFTRGTQADAGITALAQDLDGFVAEMQVSLAQARQEALEGALVAKALNRHAEDIDALMHNPALAADSGALREHLEPLALTLAGLPTLQAQEENQWACFAHFAERARQVQARAQSLARRELAGRQEALIAIAREIGDLGHDIATTSERLSQEAAAAVRVAAGMARSTINLAEAGPLSRRAQPIGQVIQRGHAAMQAGLEW